MLEVGPRVTGRLALPRICARDARVNVHRDLRCTSVCCAGTSFRVKFVTTHTFDV